MKLSRILMTAAFASLVLFLLSIPDHGFLCGMSFTGMILFAGAAGWYKAKEF